MVLLCGVSSAVSIADLRPASVGSGSLTFTLRAVPVPLLVTVMVNPIWSPAERSEERRVGKEWRAGGWTSPEAKALSLPSLGVGTKAVLSSGYEAAVAAVVGEVMWTV